ncbi:MAG: esterase family protein [bacterium]|nr:esterase family protein [bacterium]
MQALLLRIAITLCALPLAETARAQAVGAFEVRFDAAAFTAPFTGPIFVAFSEEGEPRRGMHSWFNPPPVLRFDLADVASGSSVTLTPSDAAAHHPLDWASVSTGKWRVQAVARLSATGRQAGLGVGDAYSAAVEIEYEPSAAQKVLLSIETAVEPEPFEESERVKLFEHTSPALSKFHGFDYALRAGVLLPKDHDKDRRYPVVYSVTGFGGSHTGIRRWESRVTDSVLDDCIVVVPDANNRYGHSVFCDSASIGPWGHALVNELIPALEKEYGGAGAAQRYVTGVSSGGWSSLWLQVTYPETFAGCWSHVPDPIDFHDFQQIDLYTPLEDGTPRNMYVDENGEKRPLARRGGEVMLTAEQFIRREDVLNPGGQIRSFEGTFSPLGEDGTPRRVFDVETGAIDHEAAKAWRKYDISHVLLTGWDALEPRLGGKIHVYAGEVDTFYLEGAVERFQGLAREAGMLDAMHIEVVPGMAHSRHRPGHEAMIETIAKRARATD